MLGRAVYPSFAMLAGMQLDLFTPLKDGPMHAEQIAEALGVGPTRFKPLLYTLVAGSNLDTNKARLLLMASMLKLGRLPKAKDPRNPSAPELEAIRAKIAEFQHIFESH